MNTDNINDIEIRFSKLCTDAARAGALRRLILSKCINDTCPKIIMSLYNDGNIKIAAEYCYDDGRRVRKNYDTCEILDIICEQLSNYKQGNLITTSAQAQFTVSKKGKLMLSGENEVRRSLQSSADAGSDNIDYNSINKSKNYIFSGNEEWLVALGISDGNGRVHDKKQSKYRQINRFTELLVDVYDELPADGTLNICDLCCGKSYLSFAVYFYLTKIRGREVNMLGVDRKREVIDYCNQTAALFNTDGLHFINSDISDDDIYENAFHGSKVNLVISLHACDIATDLVLRRAVSMCADVILSTPCCHHELFGKINNADLSFITGQSLLSHKLSDAATDAMRVKMLEIEGYRVQTVELIDPDETPKNIMIRAVRIKGMSKSSVIKKVDEYNRIIDFLGISGSYYDIYNK